jgi:L,D-peptidoglycan transpeptidase YkuD (ErfK/YbiS/YcfS/YnhG family)
MSAGRVLSSCAAVLAVAASVVVALGMSNSAARPDADETPFTMPSLANSTVPVPGWNAAATPRATPHTPGTPYDTPPAAVDATTPNATADTAPKSSAPKSTAAGAGGARPTTARPPATTRAAAGPTVGTRAAAPLVRGQSLPIGGTTSGATRVITVVAPSYGSTTATLQAWDRASGGGWLRHGSAVLAHVGSQGLTTRPSESESATPIGSFTLTQAFGAYGNPGTGLPYFRTTAADWWISQSGSLYNTHQRCSSGCAFNQGSPNEHLRYETPYYNYAVVIDYNTRNSPTGVRQGAGSAFFLHVTDGTATAGCVAIPQSTLVSIMRWLTPATHPRILIGVA